MQELQTSELHPMHWKALPSSETPQNWQLASFVSRSSFTVLRDQRSSSSSSLQ